MSPTPYDAAQELYAAIMKATRSAQLANLAKSTFVKGATRRKLDAFFADILNFNTKRRAATIRLLDQWSARTQEQAVRTGNESLWLQWELFEAAYAMAKLDARKK